MNLPDVNWEMLTIDGRQYPLRLNERFLECLQNCGLQQMVTFPTRGDNTSDIVLTNRPPLVNKCAPLPGIGDHDIVYTDSGITAERSKLVKRKIHLWNKACVDNMNSPGKLSFLERLPNLVRPFQVQSHDALHID